MPTKFGMISNNIVDIFQSIVLFGIIVVSQGAENNLPVPETFLTYSIDYAVRIDKRHISIPCKRAEFVRKIA